MRGTKNNRKFFKDRSISPLPDHRSTVQIPLHLMIIISVFKNERNNRRFFRVDQYLYLADHQPVVLFNKTAVPTQNFLKVRRSTHMKIIPFSKISNFLIILIPLSDLMHKKQFLKLRETFLFKHVQETHIYY